MAREKGERPMIAGGTTFPHPCVLVYASNHSHLGPLAVIVIMDAALIVVITRI